MKTMRVAAMVCLAVIAAAALSVGLLAPASYTRQYRDLPDAAPSSRHLLGTDELGRDRFARLLYGTRTSLLLAPTAALLAALLAGVLGGTAGFLGGWYRSFVMAAVDLFLSLPWFFLLLLVRALLPLNVSPLLSVAITFALLGCLGWAGAARVACAEAHRLATADFVLMARSTGSRGFSLFWRHVMPNLKPVLLAQFWISIPVFILAEANLGMLGLGVAEPLPSWGSLLRELESLSSLGAQPWRFVPLALLVLTVGCFDFVLHEEDSWATSEV